MLHFSHGGCDTFTLRKRFFCNDDFSMGLDHPVLLQPAGRGARAQGGAGRTVGEVEHMDLTQVTIPVV